MDFRKGNYMVYGYSRCSTNENKQDITRQIRELEEQGVKRDNIYFEYASGIKEDRTELKKLLAVVKEGDIIVATEVSRITRSTKQLCEIIEFAKVNHIKLCDGILSEVDDFIANSTENLSQYIEKIKQIISGFETPFGMELLGTIHWVVAQEGARNIDETITKVHNWNDRKKQLMSPQDITIAYNHLKMCGLI